MKNVWDWQEFRWLLREPWKIPGFLLKNIKYSWQRITKGYCDMDLWSIDDWFMGVMPDMLQQFKDTKHGSPVSLGKDYVNENGILCNDSCHDEWNRILEQMIFLFREMNRDTCQKKNPYEKEHENVWEEFEKKYGIFGEGIEMEEGRRKIGRKICFPEELPEYKDSEDRYYAVEKELTEYREACKNKAFELFSTWFYDLWD